MDCDMQASAQGHFIGTSYSSHENLDTSLGASTNRFIRLSQVSGSHIHSTISKTKSANSVACLSLDVRTALGPVLLFDVLSVKRRYTALFEAPE